MNIFQFKQKRQSLLFKGTTPKLRKLLKLLEELRVPAKTS